MRQLWALGNPLAVAHRFWAYRDLIRQLTVREIEARYRGSFLGILWALINPLVLLAIYTFIFSVIFKARWGVAESQGILDFALTLFTGMTAFSVFNETVNRSSTVIVGSASYVKKVVFPLEVLPLSLLGASVFHSLISLGLVLVGLVITTGRLHPTLIYVPLVYLPLCVITLGLSWFVASLGVFIRDLGNIVGLATQILFFMTPILYPISIVPQSVAPVFTLNPLTYIIEDFRRVILWGGPPWWSRLGVVMLIAGVVFMAGYLWFMKTKAWFADVL